MNYEQIAEDLFLELKSIASISIHGVLNDFSKGEVGVLSYLYFDKNDAYPHELSKILDVSSARIASILNSLENKEYIKRTTDTFDKRKSIICITNKGKKLVVKTKKEIIEKIIKIIKEVGYDEIKSYTNTALKIKNILNDIN